MTNQRSTRISWWRFTVRTERRWLTGAPFWVPWRSCPCFSANIRRYAREFAAHTNVCARAVRVYGLHGITIK